MEDVSDLRLEHTQFDARIQEANDAQRKSQESLAQAQAALKAKFVSLVICFHFFRVRCVHEHCLFSCCVSAGTPSWAAHAASVTSFARCAISLHLVCSTTRRASTAWSCPFAVGLSNSSDPRQHPLEATGPLWSVLSFMTSRRLSLSVFISRSSFSDRHPQSAEHRRASATRGRRWHRNVNSHRRQRWPGARARARPSVDAHAGPPHRA